MSEGAVIWDVDGTLVDTAEMHYDAWVRLCGELNRPFDRADFAATFGRRNPEIFEHLFGDRFSTKEVAEFGFRKEEYYREAARKGVDLLPGVRALLEGVKAAGLRQAVGTSAPRQNLDMILRLTDTADLFDAEVTSEDTQRGKPDPQVFLLGAERLGVPPRQCVVVEDAVAGVEAAKAGGMKCVAVTFVGHHPEEKLKAAGADLVTPTLERVTVQTIRGLIA